MTDPGLILVVEDEILIQSMLEDCLKDAGFEVALACDAAEAIILLEAKTDQILALVTDVNLGKGAKGWDVARRARELVSDLPVIYMTADSGGDWSSLGVPNSVLVVKPFASGQIVTAVSTLLNEVAAHRAS